MSSLVRFGSASLALLVALALGSGCGDDSGTTSGEASSGGSTVASTGGEPAVSTSSVATPDTSGTTGAVDSSGGATTGGMTTGGTTVGEGSTDTGGEETEGIGADGRILLLGNSYTAGNNTAGMVRQMTFAAGHDFFIAAITQGGATVADLFARPDVQDTLMNETWDFVVIQGQSYEPLVQPGVFHNAGVDLSMLAQGAGAEPVMFETWARIAGHEIYDEPWSGGDPAGMQALLHEAYDGVAVEAGGTLAPVGQAWERSLQMNPEMILHSADGSHRNVAGSYLAAAVFTRVMLDEPVADNTWWPDSLTAEEAAILREHADAAVDAE